MLFHNWEKTQNFKQIPKKKKWEKNELTVCLNKKIINKNI